MKRNILQPLLIIFITILFIPAPAESTTPGQTACLKCHDNVYKRALKNNFIHRSFLNKKCQHCHVAEESDPSADSGKSVSQQEKAEVRWLQKHYAPALSHFFLVSRDEVDDTLFVQIRGKGGSSVTSLTLPPLEKLPQLENDGREPAIFNNQFLGVKRGIFYSAAISWETDKPSVGQIHYGIGSFNHKTGIDDQYKTAHRADLAPLKPDKTYNYILIANDIHGNRVISEPMTFSTDKLSPGRSTTAAGGEVVTSPVKKLKSHISAVGQHYFISITADQPTYMNIGSHLNLQPRIDISKTGGAGAQPADHIRLKSSFAINIDSCLSCHQDYKNTTSHPINVPPKRGMIFPKDYPLLDDGRIHCMTCHEPHSANNAARLRRSSKKALCTGCHKEYG